MGDGLVARGNVRSYIGEHALALAGSSGLLEVAVRDGSAARQLGITRGARVVLRTAAG